MDLDRDAAPLAHGVGGFFARMAYFEAASIDAFDILERELREHGAPSSLIRSTRAARRDEVRHADIAEAIAREHGTPTTRPTKPLTRTRDLEVIALENATEGCVNETYSAALAMWQAEHAAPHLRAHFARIARDEARHAALAHRVDAWIMQRLPADARRRVDRARHAKWSTLRTETNAPALGLPSPDRAKALARAAHRASMALMTT